MADDTVWRKRFRAFALVRLFGLGLFLLGLAIAFSDLARPGGWPLVGGLLVIAGLIDAVVSPRLLKRMWERSDRTPE